MTGLRARLVVSHALLVLALICTAAVAWPGGASRPGVLGLAIVGTLGGTALAWWSMRHLTVSVGELRSLLDAGAAGDLTVRDGVARRGEFGDLARRFAAMADALASRLSRTGADADGLVAAAEELTVSTGEIRTGAAETAEHAGIVAAAAEQVSSNLRTVAAATEQMGASVQEIAQHTGAAVAFTSSAVDAARTATTTVARLTASSAEIGDVIRLITAIAEQTNLLALNATIEAARAGDDGKGFAVVAGEVKELARETAQATQDIGPRIEAIQVDAAAAQAAITEITTIIEEVNATQATIASAVEEQTAVTGEISRNISEAAQGADNIAGSVTAIAQGAAAASEGVGETLELGDSLARMSSDLVQATAQFTLPDRTGGAGPSVHDQITKAIGAHGAWKRRLAEALARGSHSEDVGTVAKSDVCAFGRWLGAVAPSGTDAAFHQRATTLHAQFHREAAGVLTLIGHRDLQAARVALGPGGSFAEASRVLTKTMIDWRNHTAGRPVRSVA